jgi:hypothetical protein
MTATPLTYLRGVPYIATENRWKYYTTFCQLNKAHNNQRMDLQTTPGLDMANSKTHSLGYGNGGKFSYSWIEYIDSALHYTHSQCILPVFQQA